MDIWLPDMVPEFAMGPLPVLLSSATAPLLVSEEPEALVMPPAPVEVWVS